MSSKKILLVDDSDLILGVLTEHLSNEGHTIITASDGLAGIISAYKNIPDVIITDVEMPRLQGYQLSRLLKHRREICKIPIIMHTSLSEDRDKFWASSSGADAFITKDFDNLEQLSETIEKLVSAAEKPNKTTISEDAADMNESITMEMLGSLFDRELFQSTILNELSGLDKYIASLPRTSQEMLHLLNKVCEAHIAVLILRYQKDTRIFIMASDHVYKDDVQQFQEICQRDFIKKAGKTPGITDLALFGIDNRDDFGKTRVDGRRISSYHIEPLVGKGGETVGTLHIGNLTNNYFSDHIISHVQVFCRGAGIITENAILYNTINDMKHRINSMFSKFVPREVIEDLLTKRDDTDLKVGEKRQCAILFSDIRSFTVISEHNSAEKIVNFLNESFDRMGRIIAEQGGTIDKFIGDAILAIFGAPISYENNAERAVRAAMGMAKAVEEIDTSGLVLPPIGFKIGIGVHVGEVIVGNIGSQQKFDYTVIGDNVNLASRLEGLTKHYHSEIIVSDTVHTELAETSIKMRVVDTVRVKGKENATTLYKVERPDTESLRPEAESDYNKGLKMYKMQNWTTAEELFQKVLDLHPDDYLAGMYIERCREFAKNPPEKDWEGAIRLDFK